MSVRVIIQARMGSSRLRGKTLSPLNKIPLLKRVFDTVKNLELSDDIVVVTSNLVEDDPIEAYCLQFLKCNCFRGDLNNVLSRFVDASLDCNENDTIVRITADNIFYQKVICKQLLQAHTDHKNDYTGIKGLSHIACELIKVAAIRQLIKLELNDYEKEHVTPYYTENPEVFKTAFFDRSHFGLKKELDCLLTVDSEQDRTRVEELLIKFENERITYTKDNLYNWLKMNK